MHVNLEQRHAVLRLDVLDGVPRSAVEVSVTFNPFNKLILLYHLLELLLADKEEVLTVDFSFSGLPGRIRYAVLKLSRILVHQLLDQNALPNASGTDDNERLVLPHLCLCIQLDLLVPHLGVGLDLGKQLCISHVVDGIL